MDTKAQQIMGVKIDNLSKEEITSRVVDFLSEDKFHQIATVNPEFILEAQRYAEFKNILNACDLRVADGVGIWFAFLRFGKILKTRMAGADLVEEILRIAAGKNYKIFLAVNSGGLSSWEETRDAILQKYPSLNISGASLNKNTTNYQLQTTNADIVFCNFGAPNQEKFLYSLKNQENGKIRLGMGVGGSFDYLTGKVRRAPKILQAIGMEWLFRLIQQPWEKKLSRLKRIFRAVVIFPIKIIFKK